MCIYVVFLNSVLIFVINPEKKFLPIRTYGQRKINENLNYILIFVVDMYLVIRLSNINTY